jgi:hypothetical protein
VVRDGDVLVAPCVVAGISQDDHGLLGEAFLVETFASGSGESSQS